MPATDRPIWARLAEKMTDADDTWREETDSENVFGESCTACFEYEVDGFRSLPAHCYDEPLDVYCHLTGLIVDDGHGLRYLDRTQAFETIGYKAVLRLESEADASMTDDGPDPYDERCDMRREAV